MDDSLTKVASLRAKEDVSDELDTVDLHMMVSGELQVYNMEFVLRLPGSSKSLQCRLAGSYAYTFSATYNDNLLYGSQRIP